MKRQMEAGLNSGSPVLGDREAPGVCFAVLQKPRLEGSSGLAPMKIVRTALRIRVVYRRSRLIARSSQAIMRCRAVPGCGCISVGFCFFRLKNPLSCSYYFFYQMKTIVLKNAVIEGLPVICLEFPYDFALKELVKTYSECQWSKRHKTWWVPYREDQLDELIRFFRGKVWLDYSQLKKIDMAREFPNTIELDVKTETEIQIFIEWMRNKRYAESTIKTYSGALILFFSFLDNKEISEIENEDLAYFNTHYIIRKGFSASYQSQFINAVKLYFSIRQHKKLNPEIIDRPKKPKLLPNVLAKEEIKRILNAHKNLKHRTMLSLIYACGLRRSELLNVKITDVDSNRGLLIVRQSKGKKDRVVPLSAKTIDLLREYYKFEQPTVYLFEGEKPGSRYSAGSLQKVLKSALAKIGLRKPVTLHWLRHSYATHLLEGGTDLRYIQEILGHRSSRTTEIYTHVTDNSIRRIKSPFDDL